jgi:ANTAR domain-containing protein
MEKSRRWASHPPWAAGSVTSVDPGSGDSTWLDLRRFEALRLESRAIRQMSAEARARAQAAREQARRGRSQREVLRDSLFARLQARVSTMPVIEQAKGIVMAEQRCGPEEAFELLRRISQRNNVKLHVLAAQIVMVTAASNEGDNVTPISRGARKYLRTGTRAQPAPGDPG